MADYPMCCGRAAMKRGRTAAYTDVPTTKIDPVHHVIEGARDFAARKGLEDPHEGIDYHRVMTHQKLITDLGHAYDKLPEHDPNAVSHFEAMRNEVHQQYHHMTQNMGLHVQVTDHDPYKDVHELANDVRTNKTIKVLGTHVTGSHPFFSDEDNDKFRAVHDVFGHLGTGRGFDRHGEEAAYQAHSRMFSNHARGAMASETRGQNGSLISNGRFGPQRIALLPKHLWTPGLAHNASTATRKPRGIHSYDASCPICNDGPGIQHFAAHEVGSNVPEPHPNPNPQGVREDPYNSSSAVMNPPNDQHTWYHGTDFGTSREHPEPLKTLDERGSKGTHWNSHVGTHFTSLHPVAKGFAHDDYGYRAQEDIQGGGNEFSRVAHAHLHMANPKHYESELNLDDDFKSYLTQHHNMDGKEAQLATLGHPDEKIKSHINGFVDHLKGQGHDGLTYGNEEEGPHLHRCAIAFKSTPVTVHKWEWTGDKKEASSGSGKSRSHEDMRETPMDRVAVLVSDSLIRITAHVSGNQIDILHCPFCGSGAVIGRSDGTVECGYCTSVFTVQTQPQYNGFPQSVDGQPYNWPGQPEPQGMAPADVPEGTNLNPNTNGEQGLPPGADGPPGGGVQSSDPADDTGEDDEEGGDDSDDDGKPAFLKGKGDSKSDSKSSGSKGKNPFAKKKSYRTASGAELDEANYLAHLAIQFAQDKPKVASLVKAARRG